MLRRATTSFDLSLRSQSEAFSTFFRLDLAFSFVCESVLQSIFCHRRVFIPPSSTMSERFVTKYNWGAGSVTGRMDRSSEPFELADNPTTKFTLFVRNHAGMVYGYPFGLKLMDLGDLLSVDVRVKIWIQNSSGTTGDNHIVEKQTFEKVGETCEFIVSSSGNDHNVSVQSYRQGYDLIIHCELERVNEPLPYKAQVSTTQPLRQLLYEAHQKEIGADVTIQAGGKEFKILSLILMTQSEVFEKMLSGNFKEASTKVIQIEEVTAQIMEAFIRYLYLGTVEDDDPIEELFELGGKYMISDLKIRCAHRMTENLSPDNIARRLILSFRHKEEPLERYILKFIAKAGPSMQVHVYTSEVWRNYLNSQAQT